MARVWKDMRNPDNGELFERVLYIDGHAVATIRRGDDDRRWHCALLGRRGYAVVDVLSHGEDAIRKMLEDLTEVSNV